MTMHRHPVTEPRQRRCVLPFGAEGSQLAGLRRTVRSQLSAWGMASLVDVAQLAVTELASNVIKHVGDSAAATLVLDAAADQLRVELHDRSYHEPHQSRPGGDQESGRGLQLVAELAAAWGTARTVTGKVVWCELLLAPDEKRHRIQRAASVMEVYARAADHPDPCLVRRSALEESATSLILDVLHWLAAQGLNPDDVLGRAQTHFKAESQAA
jgi:anti-sigma regulatory factor (Ser/Thr protein kinase)